MVVHRGLILSFHTDAYVTLHALTCLHIETSTVSEELEGKLLAWLLPSMKEWFF